MKPTILGIGGTLRSGSSSERALAVSLQAAAHAGANTTLLSGEDLLLPMFNPQGDPCPKVDKLVSAFRRCDGIIISTPAYHGCLSGLIKNALDYTEHLRNDKRVYFDGLAIGCIVCAGGWQAAGETLGTLRAIVHSLRGWPTPLGALLNTSQPLFDQRGGLSDTNVQWQLETVGKQVVEFALQRPRAMSLAS